LREKKKHPMPGVMKKKIRHALGGVKEGPRAEKKHKNPTQKKGKNVVTGGLLLTKDTSTRRSKLKNLWEGGGGELNTGWKKKNGSQPGRVPLAQIKRKGVTEKQ